MLYSQLDDKKKEIKKYLKDNFPLIYTIKEPIFLLGNSIKNIIYNNKNENIFDIDLVILSNDDNIIKQLLNNNNIEYTINSFYGYKFKYNNKNIDIRIIQDLRDYIQYNHDNLFYDIKNDIMLSFGYTNLINDKLIKINYLNESNKIKNLIKYIKNERL